MSGDARWLELKELFHAALQLPASERARFLEEHSPDPELRRQVDRLLAQEESTAEFGLILNTKPSAAPPLAAGVIVDHYVIEAKLGEGGMGVVYLATDSRLKRTAVLKFLRRQDADFNSDRRARFLREARAASALNHPGIVTIYEIAEWQGDDYIAMEYVEGRTLREVLRSPLPVNDAVRYGIQIADAMTAAHDQGIVHRDLKPANIVVTARGRVKILDFGLAKLTESGAALAKGRSGPADEDENLTKAGMILGSIAYMSPEQIKGSALDTRSDVFALGSMLYEMLCGKSAFSGASPAEVLGAILHVDPPPPSSVVPEVPPPLDLAVSRCLKKDAAQRWQSMAELRAALEDLLEQSRTASWSRSRSQVSTVVIQAPAPAHPQWFWPAAGAFALAALGTIGFLVSRQPEKAPELTISPITTEGGVNIEPAISRDGQFLAYVSDREGDGHLDLWLRRVEGGGDPIRLTKSPEEESEPQFSADGSRILFRSERDGGGIFEIPSLGGTPQLMMKGGRRPMVSPDGKSVVYWTGVNRLPSPSGKIWVVDAGFTGKPRQLASDFVGALFPVWSPTGEEILFIGHHVAQDAKSFGWWSVPAAGGTPENWRIRFPAFNLYVPRVWTAGRIICTNESDHISEVKVNSRGRVEDFEPHRLTTGTSAESTPTLAAGRGRLAFASVSLNTSLYSVPSSPDASEAPAQPTRITSDPGTDSPRSITGDGRILAYGRAKPGSSDYQAWTIDLISGKKVQVLPSDTSQGEIEISPLGQFIAFRKAFLNGERLFAVPTTGGPPKELCSSCGANRILPMSGGGVWLPGTEKILINRKQSLITIDAASGAESVFGPFPGGILSPRALTHDGQWLLLLDSRRTLIARFTPDGVRDRGAWVEIPRSETAELGVGFSADGNTLLYVDSADGHRCIWGRRLDARTRQAAGPAFAVRHFHSPSLQLHGREDLRLVGGADRIFVGLEERRGAIWMLDGLR